MDIAPIPLIAPVVSISQSLELMATVLVLFPSVVTPVDVRVVNAPVFGVVEPIVPGAAHVFPVNVVALIVPVPV
jgi:hypothetical protein